MGSRLISGMQLDASIGNVFNARGIITAKDALSKTELELMELLDIPLSSIKKAIAQISLSACPPYRTVLTLMKERWEESGRGHMRTHLHELDDALHGGFPFGSVTEVVGPAGFGKTQFCLMLCVVAALPEDHGGLDGKVMYFDTEWKFHSGRMVEIAQVKYPHIFNNDESLRELASRVLVYHPNSLEDFISSLQGLEEVIIENGVKLIIIDSIAALTQSELSQDEGPRRHTILGNQAATLKYIAESFRVPIVITNQVRGRGVKLGMHSEDADKEDKLQLIAALGVTWAHAVNIRLVLESIAGQRFLKIAKSPMSDVLSYSYTVTAAGIKLVGDGVNGVYDEPMAIHNDGLFYLDAQCAGWKANLDCPSREF